MAWQETQDRSAIDYTVSRIRVLRIQTHPSGAGGPLLPPFGPPRRDTRAAFDLLTPRTLGGTRAKLRLALTALKAEHRGGHLDPPDCGYLDGTLADLERLAAG